jgi:S-adenosylmethionine-diacylglycerol 3-amino-3-carboxypropyl transferase
VAEAFARPFWPVAFDLFFSDSLLNTMFTPAATQHAPPGSYPRYFRELFERGLLEERAPQNRFLHHVWLGRYLDRDGCLPPFLVRPAKTYRFERADGTLDKVVSFSGYDLVNLSNVMDWMSPEQSRPLVDRLRAELRPGARILWRQLNNTTDRQAWFGSEFAFDAERDAARAAADRSLFYSSIHVGTRT